MLTREAVICVCRNVGYCPLVHSVLSVEYIGNKHSGIRYKTSVVLAVRWFSAKSDSRFMRDV